MIVSKDTRPEKKIYYLGGILIEILGKYPKNSELDFFDIYSEFNSSKEITVNLFSMTLDWLFLLDLIKIENNKIIKCF